MDCAKWKGVQATCPKGNGEGAGWKAGWSCHGFSCSAEESVCEGPQHLGPLLPVGAWAGPDLLAAALHATLRVRLLPEQKVRFSQGSWEGPDLSSGSWWRPAPRAGGRPARWVGGARLASPGCLVLVAQPRGVSEVSSARWDWWGDGIAAVTDGSETGPPGQRSVPSPVSQTSGPLLYLLEPQKKCAVSGEITLGAGLVQISCVAWARSLDLSGPQVPFS